MLRVGIVNCHLVDVNSNHVENDGGLRSGGELLGVTLFQICVTVRRVTPIVGPKHNISLVSIAILRLLDGNRRCVYDLTNSTRVVLRVQELWDVHNNLTQHNTSRAVVSHRGPRQL